MVRTGKDLGVFGGVLALIMGYLVLSVGLSIVGYGQFPPPHGASEICAQPLGVAGVIVLISGIGCIFGGAVGLAGAMLAESRPVAAAVLMTGAGYACAVTIAGVFSGIAFVYGALRAFNYAGSPPDKQPEWQDAESLPY